MYWLLKESGRQFIRDNARLLTLFKKPLWAEYTSVCGIDQYRAFVCPSI